MDEDFATRVGNLKRCGARTRAGTACQRRPVAGRKRCRLHGGLSPGAPRGSDNGNYKNGDWTTDAIAERQWLRSLGQSCTANGTTEMTTELRRLPASVPARIPPVRIRLVRPDAYNEQTSPPASEHDIKAWGGAPQCSTWHALS
jgi:glucans biosynthesis protein